MEPDAEGGGRVCEVHCRLGTAYSYFGRWRVCKGEEGEEEVKKERRE